MSDEIEYSQSFIDIAGGLYEARWLDLHFEILYAKCIYYKGVGYGFKPMADEEYDWMEQEYKDISKQLNKEPSACSMVGWNDNPILESVAFRSYDEKLYNKIKDLVFTFGEDKWTIEVISNVGQTSQKKRNPNTNGN